MKTLSSSMLRVAGLPLAVATFSTAAIAQGQPSSSPAIEEVVVTAQRRSEQLEDVPISIIAISPETLERSGITNIHDIGQISPGVQVDFNGAFTQPAIRGVTTLTNGNTIQNNVAIYIDGFYQSNPSALDMDLVNLQSIEILKGPQGTLYGRNATGGAILINSIPPSDEFTGKFDVSYGRFNDRRIGGYVSGPISDAVRFSVSAYDSESDNWIKFADPNVVGGKDGDAAPSEETTIRTKLAVDVTDGISATFAYNYFHSDKVLGLLFGPNEYRPSYYPPPPLSPRPQDLDVVAFNYKTKNDLDVNEGTMKLVFDTGIGPLTSYTGVSNAKQEQTFDFDGSYADITYFLSEFEQKTFQQTIDYNITAIDDLDLVVGGMYYHDDHGTDPLYYVYGSGLEPLYLSDANAKAEAYAAYADASYQLTDRLNLSIGGRYSEEKATSSFHQYTTTGDDLFPDTEKSKDYSKFTWSASARYSLGERTNVYASFATGFRSGYFNLSGAATPESWLPLDPEVIDAYEIGFKTASDTIRFNAAAFYYDYEDLQLSVTAPSPNCPPDNPGCAIITLYSNAPKAEIYGVDGQLTASATENLEVSLGLAWLHARYKEVPNASGTGLDIASMTNVSGQTQDWSGQEMTRAPELSGNLNIQYEIPLSSAGIIRLIGNVSYTDDHVINNPSLYGPLAGDLANKQRYRQDSLTLVNARVTWTDVSEQYSVALYSNNLTDEDYRQIYSGGAFGDYGISGEPISYGIELGYRF